MSYSFIVMLCNVPEICHLYYERCAANNFKKLSIRMFHVIIRVYLFHISYMLLI